MATKKNATATLTVNGHDDSGLPAHARASGATTLRRCVGSKTFAIEPHDAPLTDFPVQPSRKDGLGAMCKTHWTEYTRSLRQAQRARQAGGTPADAPVVQLEDKRATRAPRRAVARTGQEAPAIEEARALLAETDLLGGDAYLAAIASDPVQDALRIVASTADGPAIHEAMRERQVKYEAAITEGSGAPAYEHTLAASLVGDGEPVETPLGAQEA